jgi:hypothetical protein
MQMPLDLGNPYQTCVLLNGPPNCGKDTLADLLTDFGFDKHEFKAQLYEDTANHYGVSVTELTALAKGRDTKEVPWVVTGLSPREMLIHVSENVIKPNEGLDYFGVAAAQRCQEGNATLAVFADSGFETEWPPLADLYENLVVFRLTRAGCSFAGDSRGYLTNPKHIYDIALIDGQPDRAVTQIVTILEDYLQGVEI